MNKKILVIAAHPDDEVLGAGGVIKKHAKNGDSVYCLILGRGVESRFSGESEKSNWQEKARNKESLDAVQVLGIKEIFFEDFPDQRFDAVDFLEIVKKVEIYISRICPDIIYTHYGNDLNLDHKIVFQAVATACRPCNENCPKEIYCFEVLSSTEWQLGGEKFEPNVYVDIKEEIGDKVRAMESYRSELRNWPHSRSVEGVKTLAKYRGIESGVRFAEAFKLVRMVVD